MNKKIIFFGVVLILLCFNSFLIAEEPCYVCPSNNVTGNYSSAFGYNNSISGYYSFGTGVNSSIYTPYSISIGNYISIDGRSRRNSIAIGNFVGTTESYSMVIGNGFDEENKLINNFENSLMIGFNSTVPTLFIRSAPNASMTNPGFIGVGTTNPTERLDVNGNVKAHAFIGDGSQLIGLTNSSLWNNEGTSIYYNGGKVGIGTNQPHKALTVRGGASIGDDTNDPLIVVTDEGTKLIVKYGGNVGIGTNDPKGYMLAVAGSVIAEEVVVKLQESWGWPDYVFDSTYNLLPINQLEEFVKHHGHLPEVPNAKEVESGINVGEMNVLLLKKIEELTLYLIYQQKEIDQLKKIVFEEQ